jgi:hypothetical protein
MLYLDFYRENITKRLSDNNGNLGNPDGKNANSSPIQDKTHHISIGPKALLKRCIRQGSKSLKILSL